MMQGPEYNNQNYTFNNRVNNPVSSSQNKALAIHKQS